MSAEQKKQNKCPTIDLTNPPNQFRYRIYANNQGRELIMEIWYVIKNSYLASVVRAITDSNIVKCLYIFFFL